MHSKKIIIAFFAVVLVLLAGTASSFSKKPRNLKLLPQDISEERLDSIMHSYNKALDVSCEFCHSSDKKTNKVDFASDANPVKEVARKMLKMTIDINKQNFNTDSTIHPAYLTTVTCNTCHRGNAYPNQ